MQNLNSVNQPQFFPGSVHVYLKTIYGCTACSGAGHYGFLELSFLRSHSHYHTPLLHITIVDYFTLPHSTTSHCHTQLLHITILDYSASCHCLCYCCKQNIEWPFLCRLYCLCVNKETRSMQLFDTKKYWCLLQNKIMNLQRTLYMYFKVVSAFKRISLQFNITKLIIEFHRYPVNIFVLVVWPTFPTASVYVSIYNYLVTDLSCWLSELCVCLM